ncbi:L-idonate 5-dehydrogenase [Microvirga pudoricolor]|uniref:L-idonate 5-dehydrogenase n=1 Tax=Microvirga pudoricolor TaxID=2778729 RepID=UPI0019500F2A|nr:L-idonate 5-dehydrogenase [Microvirga pudoricolor]MBM6596455.1 L-idonate 5-dehydrogenase [Microvirga pudoricolor]
MMDTALSATLFGAEDLRMIERPLEPLDPGMVRVRFAAGGICGSDMHYFRHGRTGDFVVETPLTLGHEIAGEILEVGGETTGVSVGDRVAVNPSRWCGHCARCRDGRPNLCENIYFMGSASKKPHMQGGFASVFDVVPAQCVKVSDDTPLAAAALAEPLAVCLHAINRASPLDGKRGIVFGAGPIGLLTVLAARLAGLSEIAVVDVAAAPLAFAQRLGADHIVDVAQGDETLKDLADDRCFDVAFEVSGTVAGLSSAIRNVRRGGTIVQIGNLPAGPLPIPANAIMSRELDLKGSFRFGDEFARAVHLIDEGRVDVLSIVTAKRPLSLAEEGFRLALDRSQSVKVLLTAE